MLLEGPSLTKLTQCDSPPEDGTEEGDTVVADDCSRRPSTTLTLLVVFLLVRLIECSLIFVLFSVFAYLLKTTSHFGKCRNPSSGSLQMTSDTGSLDRAKAAYERRKKNVGSINDDASVSGRVEITRVDPADFVADLLKSTNLEQPDDSAESKLNYVPVGKLVNNTFVKQFFTKETKLSLD